MVCPKDISSCLDPDKWLGVHRLACQEAMSTSFANTVVALEAPIRIPASSLRVRLGCFSSLPPIYGKEEEERPNREISIWGQVNWEGFSEERDLFYFHVCTSV